MIASAAAPLNLPSDQIAALVEWFVAPFYTRSAGLDADTPAADAFAHFLAKGLWAGLPPTPLFDNGVYVKWAREAGLPAMTDPPFLHWLDHGVPARIVPTKLFDERFYRSAYPDIANDGHWGFRHFVRHGVYEGRRPHAWFDHHWFAARHGGAAGPMTYLDYLGAEPGFPPTAMLEPLLKKRTAPFGRQDLRNLVVASAAAPLNLGLDQIAALVQLFVAPFYARAAGLAPDTSAADAFGHFLATGLWAGLSPTPLFDGDVYVKRAAEAGLPAMTDPPFLHWLERGVPARIVPTEFFDERFYRSACPDIVDLGLWVFRHFAAHGVYEGRRPHAWFDPHWYAAQLGDADGATSYLDYLGDESELPPTAILEPLLKGGAPFGRQELRKLVAASAAAQLNLRPDQIAALVQLFVAPFYGRSAGLDADISAADALAHFLTKGLWEGLSPTPLFDDSVYVTRSVEVGLPAMTEPPFLHWLKHGVPARIVPTEFFDERFYRSAYPDIADNDDWGFWHFAAIGMQEGHWPHAWFDPHWYAAQRGAADGAMNYLDYLGSESGLLSTGILEPLLKGGAPSFGGHHLRTLVAASAAAPLNLRADQIATLAELFVVRFYTRAAGLDANTLAVDAFGHFLAIGLWAGLSPTPLFDGDVYVKRAAEAGLPAMTDPPFLHWLERGVPARIVPTEFFDERFYRSAYPDIADNDDWGFWHFATAGVLEGRRPHAWFDTRWFAAQHGAADGAVNYLDYLGGESGLLPTGILKPLLKGETAPLGRQDLRKLVAASAAAPLDLRLDRIAALVEWFVAPFYKRVAGLDAETSAVDALAHFLARGLWAGLPPTPLFDTGVYAKRAAKTALPAMTDPPFLHWLEHGVPARIVPTKLFDERFYRSAYPDVTDNDLWGFRHFAAAGVYEERRPARRPFPFFKLPAGPTQMTGTLEYLTYKTRPALAPASLRPVFDWTDLKLRRLAEIDKSTGVFDQIRAIDQTVPFLKDLKYSRFPPLDTLLFSAIKSVRRNIDLNSCQNVVCVGSRSDTASVIVRLLTQTIIELFPGEACLIVETSETGNRPVAGSFDRVPTANIATEAEMLNGDEAARLLYHVLVGMGATRVFNVDSLLCWSTFAKLGRQLSQNRSLYAHLRGGGGIDGGRSADIGLTQYLSNAEFCDALDCLKFIFADNEGTVADVLSAAGRHPTPTGIYYFGTASRSGRQSMEGSRTHRRAEPARENGGVPDLQGDRTVKSVLARMISDAEHG